MISCCWGVGTGRDEPAFVVSWSESLITAGMPWASRMLGTACCVASGISAEAWASTMLWPPCLAGDSDACCNGVMLGTACFVASGTSAKA